MKIKWLTYIILFWGISLQSLNAQRERNYIYLFDCTQSMKGFKGAPDIWEQTKDYLHNELGRMDAFSTIHLVPFQDKVHPVISFRNQEYDWGKINNQFNKYVEGITNTNICEAWDKGISLFDPHKDNYLFLLTDGEDNCLGMEAVCDRIRKWCGQYKNSYGFYVMLTPAAKNQKIVDAISTCSTLFVVEPGKQQDPFGILETTEIVVNSLDLKPCPISFSIMGDFSTDLHITDNYFNAELEGGKITKGKGSVNILPRQSLQDIRMALNGEPDYTFKAIVQMQGVHLLNNGLTIRVINDPERLLEIPYDQVVHLKKASYYPSFCFWKEKEQDLVDVQLKLNFNEEARKNHSSVTWTIHDKENNNDFVLFINGEELADRSFVSSSDRNELNFSIKFNDTAKTGKRYLILNAVDSYALERINMEPPLSYQLELQSVYSIDMHPVKKGGYTGLVILVILLLLWFLLLKRIFFPKFQVGSISIYSPYFSTRKLHKCRKLVYTNQKKKQSFFNRVLTGEVIYDTNNYWTSDLVVLPKNKNSVSLQGAKEYIIDPYAVNLDKHQDYIITNQTTGEKLELLIN